MDQPAGAGLHLAVDQLNLVAALRAEHFKLIFQRTQIQHRSGALKIGLEVQFDNIAQFHLSAFGGGA